MIKAEVVFDENKMSCNGWVIEKIDVQWNDVGIRYSASYCGKDEYFKTQEQAIKYCMEN